MVDPVQFTMGVMILVVLLVLLGLVAWFTLN